MWESLENQIHGMFILIVFSSLSATEIGNQFFSFICFFDGLLGSLENQCDWCEIFIGCPEYWSTWDRQIYVVLGLHWGTIKVTKRSKSGNWVVWFSRGERCIFASKKRTHLSPSKLGFLEKLLFLKGFSRCHFDFYPITSIPCTKASWGGGFRLAVFDLENGCRGDHLTILEPLPSPFSSGVCLSRQVFCAHEYLDKNYIFPWFESVCSHFAIFWRAMPVQQDISFWQVKIYYAKQDCSAEHLQSTTELCGLSSS